MRTSQRGGRYADQVSGDRGIDEFIGVRRRAAEQLFAQRAPHDGFEFRDSPARD